MKQETDSLRFVVLRRAGTLSGMLCRTGALLVLQLASLIFLLGPASAKENVAFDLVTRVAADPNPSPGIESLFRGAHGQTRTSVRTPLPATVSYPITVPTGATLSFGHTLSAAAFMVETPDLAEPARFLVRLTEDDGTKHLLFDRKVDLRENESDRRWFDERIDLASLEGKTGTLSFIAENLGDAEKAKQSSIYWSTPRITTDASSQEVNLLFITIDCLRADHVGAYGYPRDVTPNLDRLALGGVRFANAYANAPMTLPSIPQIFTSRVFPTRDQDTFTHPIARAGIANAAFVNNAWIPLWLSQGEHAKAPGTFDRLVSGDLDATAITNKALTWLEKHPKSRFALYLHYLDAHTPYRPPESYIQRWADPEYQGPVGNTFNDNEGADLGKYNEADRAKIIALYDAAIAYVDEQIGRLLDALRSSGRLEQTLVIVSADHGEEFWDHGRFFHGQSLYDELLHVPLIVHVPGGAPSDLVVERPVRSIDIAPSILDWLELPAPNSFSGTPLREALQDPQGQGELIFATATQAQFPTRYAIRSGNRKLIETLETGESELYETGTDPGEEKNLAMADPAQADPLAQKLEEARRILRERGYQFRIVGPQKGEVEVTIRLEGQQKSGTFLTVDRLATGQRPRIAISKDGSSLEASARVDEQGTGFRFDRLPDPRNLGRKDLVRIVVEVDGKPLTRDRIALGKSGRPPRNDRIDLRSQALETNVAPDCAPVEEGVRVCAWRFPGEKFLAIPEIKDPAVREKLRALGYLQ